VDRGTRHRISLFRRNDNLAPALPQTQRHCRT
jgi:hypothetical protein